MMMDDALYLNECPVVRKHVRTRALPRLSEA